ncbi:MAG: hypothetical protein HSCHL_1628 [Hydrogenibacillus schlegelii]|uniref:Uncharacterized protein n=1 Tax=Hydrogenibacillus schlegelii TaxID=1484 RepID=A0A2T5G4D6_HYDSH|nr:hypothetical protein [Hydrogenibacillus schlegelii]PTQ51038.1 MAG: hypothetical protein HSCHL_1628 [Hydrogenibacillus schlegelii]
MKNAVELQTRAEQLAREIFRLEAALKQLKDELKAIVEQSGPVTVDGRTWAFYPAVDWQFTPQGLREFAEALALDGIDPWAVLDVSSTALKKIGVGEDVLSRYAEKKETLRFYAKAQR